MTPLHGFVVFIGIVVGAGIAFLLIVWVVRVIVTIWHHRANQERTIALLRSIDDRLARSELRAVPPIEVAGSEPPVYCNRCEQPSPRGSATCSYCGKVL